MDKTKTYFLIEGTLAGSYFYSRTNLHNRSLEEAKTVVTNLRTNNPGYTYTLSEVTTTKIDF